MDRSQIKPILEAIPAARQEDARHYGVHPYFTRRPANVVRAYVERYSQMDDVVLDPFGGTGVTAIEAFLLKRHAIHNDLNPSPSRTLELANLDNPPKRGNCPECRNSTS